MTGVGDNKPLDEALLPVVRSACMLNFWAFDHAIWLAAGAKVLDRSPARLSVAQSRFWLGAVLCSLYLDTKELGKAIAAAEKTQDGSSAAAAAAAQAKGLVVREVRNLCDLVVASNNSALVRVPPLLVGICGALSAASVVYEAVAASSPSSSAKQ